MEITYRDLGCTDSEFQGARALLTEQGPNDWNYLAPEEIAAEFAAVKNDKGSAKIAVHDSEIVGYCINLYEDFTVDHMSTIDDSAKVAQIGNVVVDARFRKNGVANRLLRNSLRLMKKLNFSQVYVERHEENVPMGNLLKKIGFEKVKTYSDPVKRFSGSKKTTLSRIDLVEFAVG